MLQDQCSCDPKEAKNSIEFIPYSVLLIFGQAKMQSEYNQDEILSSNIFGFGRHRSNLKASSLARVLQKVLLLTCILRRLGGKGRASYGKFRGCIRQILSRFSYSHMDEGHMVSIKACIERCRILLYPYLVWRLMKPNGRR